MKRLLVFLLAASCGGQIGDGHGNGNDGTDPDSMTGTGGDGTPPVTGAGGNGGGRIEPPACMPGKGLEAAHAALRRLTRREYNNTVRDLLGDSTNPASTFVTDAVVGHFDNNTGSPVTLSMASEYMEAALTLAETAVTNRLAMLAPCTASAADDACARSFIQGFGKRAFRRPLTTAEVTRYFMLFSTFKQGADFANGARIVIATMLQSPNFLDHHERGETPKGGATTVALTPYETASRLSYFLWNSMPDAALFQAADSGALDLHAQVTRMLADDKAKAGIIGFFTQWMDLDQLAPLRRSLGGRMGDVSTVIKTAMRQSTEAFVNHVMWQGDGKLTTLLQSPLSFVNASLASTIYGMPGVTGDTLQRVDLDPARYAGLLTQPSLLTLHAQSDSTDPVHRGLMVRQRFMCQEPPPPPSTVSAAPPQRLPGQTTRQAYLAHHADPFCAPCHLLMDPVGLGFENYDQVGRYRTKEGASPVDASGEMKFSQDMDGTFTGAIELSGKLAGSGQVRTCFTNYWVRYATGGLTDDLGCFVSGLSDGLGAQGTDIRKLVIALATSESFRSRKAIPSGACQ